MSSGGGQHYQKQIFDPTTGLPYSRLNIYHYIAGTETTLAAYDDEDLQTPSDQPIVSTDGSFEFYGKGLYDLKLTTGTPGDDEAELETWEDVAIFQHHDGRRSDNLLTSFPSASAANKGHVVHLYNDNSPSADTYAGWGININESSFTQVKQYNSIGIEVKSDLIMKYPVADVRHPDFGGGMVAGSAADQSSKLQAAADYMEGLGGGDVFIPPGVYKVKNVDWPASVRLVGTGHASTLELFDADDPNNYIIKSTNEQNLEIINLRFLGGDLGNNNRLIWFYNNTGLHVHVRLFNLHFQDQAAATAAIVVEGISGSRLPGVIDISGGCHFHELDTGIVFNYVDGFVAFGNLFNDITGSCFSISESTEGVILGNNCKDWGVSFAAVKLVNTDDSVVGKNMLKGTEAKSIETTGTSNYNAIEGNNVRGGHANDIISAGTNDFVGHNPGSSVFKNGQGETGGVAGDTDWDFVKYTGTTTSAGTSNGRLIDTAIVFPDTAAAVDDPDDLYDHVRLSELTNDENMFFSVNDILTGVDDNTLQLGNSDVVDSALTISADLQWDAYPNFLDTASDRGWDWEDNAFWTQSLSDASSSEQSVSKTIYGEQGLFRVEVWANSGTQAGTARMQCTGVSKKDIVYNTSTSGSAQLSTSHIFKPSGSHTFNFYVQRTVGSGAATMEVRLYRLKRNVDLTG